MKISLCLCAWGVFLLFCSAAALAADGQAAGVWKTAYIKRNASGDLGAGNAGGEGAYQRSRVPMYFDGDQVRVVVQGSYAQQVDLVSMKLFPAADDRGAVIGAGFALKFKGSPQLSLPVRHDPVVSDVIDVPVKKGIWYLQDLYSSKTFPYAYEVDQSFWFKDGDKPARGTLPFRTGISRRIDVRTTDPRPIVLCYGDSITAGAGATPNAGRRYPEVLAKLIDRPVLNAGVNGDIITQNQYSFMHIAELAGVEQVIFLMGINDICAADRIKTTDDYAKQATIFLTGMREKKIKTLLGTLTPATGCRAFDDSPAKEALRREINAWIRATPLADGVADFDQALQDPDHPARLLPQYSSGDWIHPSDAGYQKMAEAAAEALGKLK